MIIDLKYIRSRALKDRYQDTDYPEMVLKLIAYIEDLEGKLKRREKRKAKESK